MGIPRDKNSELLPQSTEPLFAITKALERLHYGVIQLTVHNGKLVQLEITEKLRFT